MTNLKSKFYLIKKLLLIDTELRLKLVFDSLTISCDAPVRSVVNRERESAGLGMDSFKINWVLHCIAISK
jgi:hypothetical protein